MRTRGRSRYGVPSPWVPMLFLLLAAAFAAKTGADVLENEWRSLQLLQADPGRYRIVEEPLVIEQGPVRVTVHDAVLVPVFSGHFPNERAAKKALKAQSWVDGQPPPAPADTGTKELVGFVFTEADAEVTLSWVERADHLVFANHLVRNLGEPKDALAPVAEGQPWTTGVREGLVLGIDPALRALFLGPDPEADPFEVVVYGDKPRLSARQRAVQLLESRVALMAAAGLPAGRWIASDRVAAARGMAPPSGAHGILDLHVDTNLGRLTVGARSQPSDIDWMIAIRDETGTTDSRLRIRVSTFDRAASGAILADRLVGVPFPPSDPADPLSPPRAPIRVETTDAFVDVLAVPRAADIEVEMTARLKVTAVGGTVQWFDLNVPRAGNPRAFEVRAITRLDGTPLLAETPLVRHDPVLVGRAPPEPEPDPDDAEDPDDRKKPPRPKPVPDPYLDRPESSVTVALPEPLGAGESVVFDVVWRDVFPWAQVLFGGLTSAGEGSGLQGFLPRLAGAPTGNPSPFRVRIRTPARTRLRAAVSGATTRQWTEGEWNITEAGVTDHPVVFANLALSRFVPHDEPAAEGFPGVRTRLLGSQGPMFAAETRRLIGFYEGYLPPYPWPEHEVFQAPSSVNGYVWIASHEMTQVMTALTVDMMASAALGKGGNVSNRVFAHELAHVWWGHLVRPGHAEDFWVAETMAESFACAYMDAAFGACAAHMGRKRERWEQWEPDLTIPRASLTDAYGSPYQPRIVYDYGPYVFQEMLRPRIGHLAYHAALDVLVQDKAHQAVTTEHLLDYFSRATGTDQRDFFDFWVYGGFVPERIELGARDAGADLQLEVTVDVPFGALDVPVVLDATDTVWVPVADGVGTLTVPGRAGAMVALDPDGRVLAKKRVVRDR